MALLSYTRQATHGLIVYLHIILIHWGLNNRSIDCAREDLSTRFPNPSPTMDGQVPFPEPHVVLPTSNHTHTIILLHGRGSDGEEFAEELFQGESFSEHSLPQHFPGFKWIFPSAHPSFSTVFQEDLVEWFDIYSLTEPSLEEELQIDGLSESVAFLQELITEEARLLGSPGHDRIILGGISQGCAVAVTALLTGTCGVGAFIGLNGWMPLADSVQEAVFKASTSDDDAGGKRKHELVAKILQASLSLNDKGDLRSSSDVSDEPSTGPEARLLQTPVFLSHTVDDNVIDIALGKEMHEILVSLELCKVVWKEYQTGGHWIPEPEGFGDIVEFLSATLEYQEKSQDEEEKPGHPGRKSEL